MIRLGWATKAVAHGHNEPERSRGYDRCFCGLGSSAKILVHIIIPNPVLLADSSERATLEAAGWSGRTMACGYRYECGHFRNAAHSRTARGRAAPHRRHRYHNLHPFHRLLHGGQLNRASGPGLGAQSLLLQSRIPAKDATLMRGCRLPICVAPGAAASRITMAPDRERRIERWLKLATGVGLDREYVESTKAVAGHAICRGCLCEFSCAIAACSRPSPHR